MNHRHRFDAVLFDADGTLVDSEPLGLQGIVVAAAGLGVHFAGAQELLPLKGSSMAMCLAEIERRLGRPLPPDFEATVRAEMARQFERHLKPMPGAHALLQALPVPFCVASNGPPHKLALTLSLTGLLPLLEGRLYSAYEVGHFKPDPGLFLHAAHALGAEPARCAVVEDSAPGVAAGLAAGMTVFVLESEQPLPPPLAARVQTIRSLDELLPLAFPTCG